MFGKIGLLVFVVICVTMIDMGHGNPVIGKKYGK